jgi:hypothetical protein
MRVRVADARRPHPRKYVVRSRLGEGNVVKFQRLAGLNKADGFHGTRKMLAPERHHQILLAIKK